MFFNDLVDLFNRTQINHTYLLTYLLVEIKQNMQTADLSKDEFPEVCEIIHKYM